jgi:hypothetical protein
VQRIDRKAMGLVRLDLGIHLAHGKLVREKSVVSQRRTAARR